MRLALSAAVMIAAIGSAAAQDVPNLVGTWKGSTQAVIIGSNPYRTAETTGPNFPESLIEFTYTIREQHGNRFAGEMTGGKFKETIIGGISPDNRSITMLDDDGRYDMTLRDPNTIDMCYSHMFPTSRVVACWTLTRSR